jgi:phosphopantothenoylcysteine decarboxylase
MANVLLGVTGSVAAIKTLDLVEAVRNAGQAIKVVATNSALYFFEPATLGGQDVLVVDEHEWPGRDAGRRWQRQDPVVHIELRRWADLLVIAPLDANTLAKLALGICDNCLTCVYRAWDRGRPLILAPAMNTLMWDHPATGRHLRQIAEDWKGDLPAGLDLAAALAWINRNVPRVRVMPPATKRLACDDVGVGAMADVDDIASAVVAMLATTGSQPQGGL